MLRSARDAGRDVTGIDAAGQLQTVADVTYRVCSYALIQCLFGLCLRYITRFERQQRVTVAALLNSCLLYTSPSPRDATLSRMPSSA